MMGGFEDLKRAILSMAVKARAEQRGGSSLSLISLSMYVGDDMSDESLDENSFCSFRSKSLDRRKGLLQAYMLKLD
jgi:hypothetical protein